MSQIPLMLLSDAPTAGTGLARVTQDLATRIAAHMPEFRVSTIGYGGSFTRQLPFPQYSMELHGWTVMNLPECWYDFAGREPGILMTVWDASRLRWLAKPENCEDPRIRQFLTKRPFKLWGYLPMDATGPHDKLTVILKDTIQGFDRVLAYSAWAEAILKRTIPGIEVENLPHGIDTSVFFPRNRRVARHGFGERMGAKTQKGKWVNIPDDAFFVGIVATNQIRKDWGLGLQACAEMAKERKVFLWCHTDEMERHWSIPGLLHDYGLLHDAVVTAVPYSDEQMAFGYSACDVTLGIGLGEGFGFPVFESLACGTPCVHGDYGGAPEHMMEGPLMVIAPEMMRLEGVYSQFRPVFHASSWARLALSLEGKRVQLPQYLDWNELWPRWAEWSRKGIV